MMPFAFWKSGSFNPATLSLTGWWRASYGGSPWTPTASAGSSGSNGNLTKTADPAEPAVGSAVNGFTPADFDGSNDALAGTAADTALFTGAAGSIVVLFYADAATADSGNWYGNPQLLGHNGTSGRVGVGFSDAGVVAGYYDGSSHLYLAAAASTGAWHLGQVKWDSSNLKVRVDSGAWQTLGAGAASLVGDTLRVGPDFLTSQHFNGKILEIMTAASALSDDNFNNIKSYVNTRYALSL